MNIRVTVGCGVLIFVGLVAGAWAQRPVNASPDPTLRAFEFRSIGPAIMMGRVDDIAGSEKDPMIIYAAFATGPTVLSRCQINSSLALKEYSVVGYQYKILVILNSWMVSVSRRQSGH